MLMDSVIRRFPGQQRNPFVSHAEGMNLYLDDGREIMDFTAGYSGCVALGYTNAKVLLAMKKQMDKYCYLSAVTWSDAKLGELAEILLSKAPKSLSRVFFCGSSGSEAIEAAMKLSYQVHYNLGNKKKTWFISREQSFHGSTLHCLAVTDIDIYDFYKPLLPEKMAKIPQHLPYNLRKPHESLNDYAKRSANYLEEKILEIGPENVCAFIGETMLGQLIGNVSPAENYWKYIKEICDKYDVHLILDEVYCGLGRSGKIFCCNWDDITPDFICIGKMLTAGYAPLSAVITKKKFEDVISEGQGRIMYGHTNECHSLGVAAALAVQQIIHSNEMMTHINKMGTYIREKLEQKLGNHPFVRNIRGRGLLLALEYDCKDKHLLGQKIETAMFSEHNILINSRWHRSNFTPSNIVTEKQADQVIDAYVETFNKITDNWPDNTFC